MNTLPLLLACSVLCCSSLPCPEECPVVPAFLQTDSNQTVNFQITSIKINNNKHPIIAPKCHRAAQLQHMGSNLRSKLSKKQYSVTIEKQFPLASFYNVVRSLYSSPSPSSTFYLFFGMQVQLNSCLLSYLNTVPFSLGAIDSCTVCSE